MEKVAEGTVDPTTAKWEANAHAHRSAVDRPVTALPCRWFIRPEGPESTHGGHSLGCVVAPLAEYLYK
jgi:hypothetical protein